MSSRHRLAVALIAALSSPLACADGALIEEAPDGAAASQVLSPAPSAPSSVSLGEGEGADSSTETAGLAPVDEGRLRRLLEELRCLVCQNQSVFDSESELAKDLREYVPGKMRLGWSDERIRAELAERYGEFVLYRPPLTSMTWLLWYGPAALLLLGLGIGGIVAWRRAKAVGGEES